MTHPARSVTGSLFSAVECIPAVQELRRRVQESGFASCSSVVPGAQPFLSALLRHLFPQRPIVVVAEGLKAQESLLQDIETWLASSVGPKASDQAGVSLGMGGPARCWFYPAWEVLPHESKLPHVDIVSERLETLTHLAHLPTASAAESPSANVRALNPGTAALPGSWTSAPLIVTSVVALLQRSFSPERLREMTRSFRAGLQIDPLDLVEWLEEQGYEPEARVSQKGDIALRGGILDIFPLTAPWPVRLEFFGNELESLRSFDPITQISKESIAEVTVPPGGEIGLLKKLVALGEEGRAGGGRLATLLDYLPPESLFLLCEPAAIAQQAGNYAELLAKDDPLCLRWEDFLEQLRSRGMTLVEMAEAEAFSGAADQPAAVARAPGGKTVEERGRERRTGLQDETLRLGFASLEGFRPIAARAPEPLVAEAQRKEFFSQLHRWSRNGYGVRVFCNNEGERQRLTEIWEEYGLGQLPAPEPLHHGAEGAAAERPAAGAFPQIEIGALTRGFLCEQARTVVVTDAEVFGRYKVLRPRRLKSPHAQTSRSLLEIDFSDLEEGDYVVHLQHGIGRYLGLNALPASQGAKKLENGDAKESGQECLLIEYAAQDPDQPAPRLYVPVSEAHLVSKYVGTGKARPALNTLGGGRWAKAKEQAGRAVRDLAGELLSIQAARALQEGHAFPADSTWQREFESAFLYEETRDQMRAIVETKADLEAGKPMDRLICGDVGYGKTEVAIRAAFKAVMGGKQVAVLVPTTILAQQHFNTFRERMADYPIRVELLSRFRTPREARRVVEELAAGAVDIVIGTHRLVQNDIAFKDLGLVVIDEEQRFGVMHKERFKLLRKLVDVLTLSATPIPRTLYLALTGARDMSTIETPPQDRLPVETIVMQYDERVIRDAIQRELGREGQVFYLHNRVVDIEAVALRLRGLLPKARIVVGHGQMEADALEEVMAKFVNGDADVLLSTTIIESGLDIPNANTIIIDRADRFGLSDLYQLRGRVGRYKHQAYAYLLLPRHAALLADARKRISAIKQYSTLGSGFKIAMRDLEIRGAGNLLGSQQSGHITAVGFDLYCQLLKQSISVLKGEKVQARIDVQVRLDFVALSPAEEARETETKRPRKNRPALALNVPRETATYSEFAGSADSSGTPRSSLRKESAVIPLKYISDSHQRIEIYRKLAEIGDAPAIERMRAELKDRFGPLPRPVELLLQIAGLKVLASERGVTSIETREDKLMLTRNNDFIMTGGKFPRLTKEEVKARLHEIKRLLQSL